MSEAAFTRSSSPSFTAQVVLRRRREGGTKGGLLRMPGLKRPDDTPASAFVPSPPEAAVTNLGPCVYCGRNSRDMACTAHRDLLVLDVGEARG